MSWDTIAKGSKAKARVRVRLFESNVAVRKRMEKGIALYFWFEVQSSQTKVPKLRGTETPRTPEYLIPTWRTACV